MNSRLSEHCNDESLMLDKLSELVDAGWSPRYDEENENALTWLMLNTQSLSQTSQYSGSWLGSARLRTTILGGIESLSQCILTAYGQNMSLDLEQASKVFIETAEALETILWDILQEEGKGEPGNKE
ncbi:hypothetical protein BGZ61DRAFT_564021 [Ilyonectria robusta]|uniref:uncharacterized protein n=1 Tax=Ilyonectria robusta TaxID=1079257 RepID=UPI001E8DB2A9|nr:uncharacterized protein BGZ61DRAFT_564021 [Ilyonectria robusta]KAH8661149.1 hypothetical protein BGZ61DRAFT_564021 [Ilyonectria robusta]